MDAQFFYGPDKIPFKLMENGVVEQNSAIPFHGIISRGLLNKFIEHNLSNELWHRYAHELEITSSSFALSDEMKNIKKMATDCEVLSFTQSALCVQRYIETFHNASESVPSELWNLKEGHTSSVWKVSIKHNDVTEVFVLNVARDKEAGDELRATSEQLKIIGENFPEINHARVYDIRSLKVEGISGEVVVTKNEWIENAYEIHLRKNYNSGTEEYLMVDRFLVKGNNLAQISSVVGRVFSTKEAYKVKEDLTIFLTQASMCLTQKPKININDGDVVWNGNKAIVVAIS